MAIWQYSLTVIPRKMVIDKYGQIPITLFIDNEGWKKFWENYQANKSLPNFDFEDAKTIKWWNGIDIEVNMLSTQIDKIVSKSSRGNSHFLTWKGNLNKQEDNDCNICLNEEDGKIKEFFFRVDLRNSQNAFNFLNGMLKICKNSEFLVMDVKGNLFEPDFEIIFESIEQSNAVKFLINPEEYVKEIASRSTHSP